LPMGGLRDRGGQGYGRRKPQGGETQESQGVEERRISSATAPTDRGATPEVKPPRAQAQGTGYRVILRRHRSGMANRKRGSQRRKAPTISVRSSSEGCEPRERAWLKGHQGDDRGRKASRRMVSARTQRDPGSGANPGVVALDRLVALWGRRTLVRASTTVHGFWAILCWSEPGELKHLSTQRNRNQPRFRQ